MDQFDNQKVLAAHKWGDVTGDRYLDAIYLTATQTKDSPFLKDITLVIRDGRTNTYQTFELQENAGYYPTLWLGDFTGNHVLDIFITIESGGSGGIIFAYIFSMINGEIQEIFNSIKFSEQHPYEVHYTNQYKANIFSIDPKKKYTLDLHYKGEDYLNEIYHADGKLKNPIEGWVDPIGGLYPIDLARNGKYDLLAMQKIAGRYHADGLGYVENLVIWNGQNFEINRQTVAIYGEEL